MARALVTSPPASTTGLEVPTPPPPLPLPVPPGRARKLVWRDRVTEVQQDPPRTHDQAPKRTPRRAQHRTVVLVHGYLANRGPLLPLTAYLRARGHKQILAYEYG